MQKILCFFLSALLPLLAEGLPATECGLLSSFEREEKPLSELEALSCPSLSLEDSWEEALFKAHSLYSSLHQQVMRFWNSKAWKGLEMNFESFGKLLMGQALFEISGYYEYPSQNGCFEGSCGDLNPKLRFTYINGILNSWESLRRACRIISDSHGGTNVYYSFRGSGGWANDLLRSISSKLGFISEEARNLAALWRELILEMGGAEGEGLIIHYAHSIGGTETGRAKELLTPQEQQRIRVITFGSASLLPDEGFQSVVNVVSIRDGVCWLDPVNYLRGLLNADSNVLFIGSHSEGAPMIDHMFDDYWNQWEGGGWKESEEAASQAPL